MDRAAEEDDDAVGEAEELEEEAVAHVAVTGARADSEEPNNETEGQ